MLTVWGRKTSTMSCVCWSKKARALPWTRWGLKPQTPAT